MKIFIQKTSSRLAKSILLIAFCNLWLSIFSQVVIKGPWTVEFGESSTSAFTKSPSYNLRYISPRFKWSDEWFEGEETNPERYKNMRLMLEVIYSPPLNVLCTGFNTQYRLAKYKKFSFELYGGLKFFWIQGREFKKIPYLKAGKEIWYMNLGMLCQFNLGFISPFADFGGDRILTVGAEVNFQKIYRKPKRRYKLKAKTIN